MAQNDVSSFAGFFKYLFKSDDTDHEALEGQIALMHAMRAVAKVPVSLSEVLHHPHATLQGCVHAIENHPDHVLLHVEDELDDRHSTHPNVSRRLLYLWRNREAIQSASRHG